MAINYLDKDERDLTVHESQSPEAIQSKLQKKSIEQMRKDREQVEKEVSEYRYLLDKQSNKLSKAQQEEMLKAYEKHRRKMLDDEHKREEKQALNLENKIKQERLKAREEEHKFELELQQQRIDALREDLLDAKGIGNKLKAWGKLAGAEFSKQFSKENVLEGAVKKFNEGMNKASATMNQVFDTYSKYQTTITTRLQGTGRSFGSLESSLLNRVGVTPYIKTQTLMDNLTSLVESGIAFNIEQRAFLQTVSEKVATTFDAANASLLRIVRLQQADSTASRLGMEAYLTKFLNNMFENTEYLTTSFDTVTSNLIEATSQLTTTMGVEFEYTIQKWLGSLSSVGLSEATVSNLSQALGYLQTGDISGLESSSMQNLIVMAASRAGLSYADMLTRGINIDETNKLLGSIVNYLKEIGSTTNQVVKNQYAQTFGVSISDIAAASNLSSTDVKNILGNTLSYAGSIQELSNQMSSVYARTSMADAINTFIENAQFSMFSDIAKNPVLSAIWKVTDMIQSYTGGINIPFVTAMGSGVDLNTTVENLIKLGVMGVGSLGMIGDIATGIGNTVDFANTLSALGINTSVVATSRGSGTSSLATSGFSTSQTAYLGQSSGSALYESTLSKASEDASSKIEQGKVTVSEDVDMKADIADVIKEMNTTLTKMYNALTGTLRVEVQNYGLTGTETNI